MVYMDSLDNTVKHLWEPLFNEIEFKIQIRYSVEKLATFVRVTHRKSKRSFDHLIDVVFDPRKPMTMIVLEQIGADVARGFFQDLLTQDPERNWRITPTVDDPHAQAIWALVSLVGGEFISRPSPVLEPGKENPWILSLPRQRRLLPIPKDYFLKPLDWWQVFINDLVGAPA